MVQISISIVTVTRTPRTHSTRTARTHAHAHHGRHARPIARRDDQGNPQNRTETPRKRREEGWREARAREECLSRSGADVHRQRRREEGVGEEGEEALRGRDGHGGRPRTATTAATAIERCPGIEDAINRRESRLESDGSRHQGECSATQREWGVYCLILVLELDV